MAPENVKNNHPRHAKNEATKTLPNTNRSKVSQPPYQGSQQGGQPNKKKKNRVKKPSSNFREVKFNKVIYEPPCAICNEPIKDSLSAIGMSDSGSAVHFDCMVKRLSAREDLQEGEQVLYIGGGNFAVATITDNKGAGRQFSIRKKIDHEQAVREAVDGWREQLAIAPSFIVIVEKTTLQVKEEADLADKEAKNALKVRELQR